MLSWVLFLLKHGIGNEMGICYDWTLLSQCFSDNDTVNSSPLLQWKSHTCFTGGNLIRKATELKKVRKAESQKWLLVFTWPIRNLYHTPWPLNIKSRETGINASSLLHDTDPKLARTQQTYFEFSNKPGKLLTHSLRELTLKTFIPHVTDVRDKHCHTSSAIAMNFRSTMQIYITYQVHRIRPP